ncbi:succinate dehydrogenase cytochrome B subunit [Pyricularia oryzae]|uniref:Succinate dehydrogenase subunit C n=1 Tax=Pyricularia sp. TaxID=1906497 RepID=A0A8A6NLN7_9PEZI|nr:succinate dehydrogenase cytochrome B subunit [Pyricularia oryzae]QTJ24466.1 succinate dehydrogenase subunit C [Pyricularia sp.]
MNTQRVGLMAMRRDPQVGSRKLTSTDDKPRPLARTFTLREHSQEADNQYITPINSPVSTEKLSHSDADRLLAEQRLKRPVSPHLQIYDYRQTWLSGSVWQRITGSLLTGGLYVFGAAYLVAPLTGWHLETTSMAAAVAAWPAFAKGGLKFLIAWPFTQHAIAGVRHLVWDFALGFNKPTIAKTTNVLWVTGILSAAGLAAFL